jgi:hypothetical protein
MSTRERLRLSIALLRYVREALPTEAELLAWLGPVDSAKYHVLRKAGLLRERDGRVVLSPEHCAADARSYRHENHLYLIDEDTVRTF